MAMESPVSFPQSLPAASFPSASQPLHCAEIVVLSPADFPPSEEGNCSALGNEKQMKFSSVLH